jgi:alcohol dehydrogenase
MRRLMELVASRRLNLKPLLSHEYDLDHITDAYDVFGKSQRGGIESRDSPEAEW